MIRSSPNIKVTKVANSMIVAIKFIKCELEITNVIAGEVPHVGPF